MPAETCPDRSPPQSRCSLYPAPAECFSSCDGAPGRISRPVRSPSTLSTLCNGPRSATLFVVQIVMVPVCPRKACSSDSTTRGRSRHHVSAAFSSSGFASIARTSTSGSKVTDDSDDRRICSTTARAEPVKHHRPLFCARLLRSKSSMGSRTHRGEQARPLDHGARGIVKYSRAAGTRICALEKMPCKAVPNALVSLARGNIA